MSSSVSLYLQDQVKYFLVYHRVALKKWVHCLRCHLTINADRGAKAKEFPAKRGWVDGIFGFSDLAIGFGSVSFS